MWESSCCGWIDALHLAPLSPVQPILLSPLSPFSSPTQQCSSFWEMICKTGIGKHWLKRVQHQEGYSCPAVCTQWGTAFSSAVLPTFSSHTAQGLQGQKATANTMLPLFSPQLQMESPQLKHGTQAGPNQPFAQLYGSQERDLVVALRMTHKTTLTGTHCLIPRQPWETPTASLRLLTGLWADLPSFPGEEAVQRPKQVGCALCVGCPGPHLMGWRTVMMSFLRKPSSSSSWRSKSSSAFARRRRLREQAT